MAQQAEKVGKGKVLIVDDEEPNITLLTAWLAPEGYEVVAARSGPEALEVVKAERPDIVLLDVMMPNMDGFEVCRRLKEQDETKFLPVVLVTALSDREDRIRGIEAGADDFLSKPIDEGELKARVRSLIKMKGLHDRLEKSYRDLKELEQTKDTLVQMIIHDLRTPLTGISGFIDLCRRVTSSGDREKALSYLDKASRECNRMIMLINNLLDIERMEEKRFPVKFSEQNVVEIVSGAVAPFKDQAESRGQKIEEHYPDSPVVAVVDPSLIERITANLLSNAVKYTPSGGRISVSLDKRDACFELTVSDTGPGIPPEYHSRIFEKFGQAQMRMDGVKHDTGLGLAFCKLATKAHGGDIGLES